MHACKMLNLCLTNEDMFITYIFFVQRIKASFDPLDHLTGTWASTVIFKNLKMQVCNEWSNFLKINFDSYSK